MDITIRWEMKPLGNRVKMVRQSLRLSQREFGEKLGVSRDVISNIEYNRVQPKELLLKHMCDLYGVNVQWIKTGDGAMFNSVPQNNEIMEEAASIFRSLCPEFQDYALKQIKELATLQESMASKDLTTY